MFDQAVTDFAASCTGNYERDCRSLAEAVASGRITAARDTWPPRTD